MKKIAITSPHVAEPAPGMWSNCIKVGETLYVSGLTSRGQDGKTIDGTDESEQAAIIFDKMKALLEAANAKMDDVVKMTIFVTDITRNTLVWDVRKRYFTGFFPACSLVEVSALATPAIKIEIEAVAIIGSAQ
ncbi:RidA family protein [Pseudomonas thivervalensis]|uniref:RidA family protein n=1 Tax=Pseudomonas thivervalensis TaxID=86265 RepID=UPI003D6A70AC